MAKIQAGGDITAGGDIIVNEQPASNYVPFEECNIDQLKTALSHHSKLAVEERKRINSISVKLLSIAVAVGVLLSIWYFINDGIDQAMFLIGILGVFLPVVLAIKNSEQQSSFEQRQIKTIEYLNMLIRERQ